MLALIPQSGDSSDAILEVPFKALLHAKCSTYALFLYKNAFFPKKICIFAFFVVPLHPLSKSNGPLAQLNRVPHYGCGGCRFESCTEHKENKDRTESLLLSAVLFCL